MMISTTITTSHGQSATIQAESIEKLTEGIKGLANSLIDLHKELSGSDEMVQTDHGTTVPKTRQASDVEAICEQLLKNALSTENPSVNNPQQSSTIEVDIQGIPWDERIHSSGKTKTGSGQWSRRKRITDEVYESVSKELLSKVAPAPAIVTATVNGPAIPEVPQVPLTNDTPVIPAPPKTQQEQVQTNVQMIEVNVRGGGTILLTPEEHQKFERGVMLNDIIALRNAPPAVPQVPPPPVVNTTIKPTYDFETFHSGLPLVLSKLFNDKVLTTEVMNDLGKELDVPQLFLVQSDRNKSIELFNKLVERQIIQQVNF